MKTTTVKTATSQYDVCVGCNVLKHLVDGLTEFSSIVVVTDQQVAALHGAKVVEALEKDVPVLEWTVPDSESAKSLWQAECLYDFMASKRLDRHCILIALGGGVVGDLAGFVASTYHRGVRFVNCPTTLLSAVDAAVGGKTALNHMGRKNVIGTFYQPTRVLVDIALLESLDPRVFVSGLAESVKHAIIADDEFLGWHETHVRAILDREPRIIEQLILRNVTIKGQIVAADERDMTGQREKLNLGHTFAHAFESNSGFELLHGEAVALGMVAACHLSEALGVASPGLADRIRALLVALGLPTSVPRIGDVDDLLQLMLVDKKSRRGQNRFVLPESIGCVQAVDGVGSASLAAVLGKLESSPV